jgi:hypothetical protein
MGRWIRWSRVLGTLAVLTALACGGGAGPTKRPESALEVPASREWYETNIPIVEAYLKTLPESDVGQPIDGILLSDGQRIFAGDIYQGVPPSLPVGVQARLMQHAERTVAYIWIEEGGEPLALEPCGSGEQEGIRARRLGGGTFAWKALTSKHGMVYTACPPESWLPR